MARRSSFRPFSLRSTGAPTACLQGAVQRHTLSGGRGGALSRSSRVAGREFRKALGALAASLFAIVFAAGCGGGSGILTEVTGTANPQVALYTVYVPRAATVTVHFGTTTSYDHETSSKEIPEGGGVVPVYVAGMLGNTTYHIQAVIKYSDGGSFYDQDHTFTTGSYPASAFGTIHASTAGGQTPQPGVEMVNSISVPDEIAVTDLQGNVLWAYNDPSIDQSKATWLAPKLLPSGDFIAMVSPLSSVVLTAPAPTGAANLIREFDLAGNTVKQITMAQLNAALAAKGYNLTLQLFSHDITVLPNGHWLVLANTFKNVVLAGQTAPTQVLGDAIVDLDTDLNPVWVWDEFDHLDVNRHPWKFPDWTHTNAVIYSPSDGNLVVSIRHQNWIVKVNYADGAGNGDILWRLGVGGDFKLAGGADPTDWQYAQHGMHFTTSATAGVFGLTVFDNGDDRVYPGDDPTNARTCGIYGAPACYSTVPLFQIDESAMTATLQFHQILPAANYSNFGGNAETLANGDVEYDICGMIPEASEVMEVTNAATPQTVWSMQLSNYAYRAYRMPSLYPGVQW